MHPKFLIGATFTIAANLTIVMLSFEEHFLLIVYTNPTLFLDFNSVFTTEVKFIDLFLRLAVSFHLLSLSLAETLPVQIDHSDESRMCVKTNLKKTRQELPQYKLGCSDNINF